MDFLAKLHIMDYSLLLGVHHLDQVDEEDEQHDSNDPLSEEDLEDDYDSGGSGVALTPPDSPQLLTR